MRVNFPFAAWPYISFVLLIVGIVVRYLLMRKRMESVVSEATNACEIFAGNKVWRASLILLAVAHLGLLFFPGIAQNWASRGPWLYTAEVTASFVGVVAVCCSLILFWRYLGRSTQTAIVELGDAVFLALLFIGTGSGVLLAVVHRWASTWAVVTLSPYLASLFLGRPAAQFVIEMPLLVRMHVFCAFALIAVLPLTRLAAFILLAIDGSLSFFSRPLAALGQTLAAHLRKHDPAAWIWPEED